MKKKILLPILLGTAFVSSVIVPLSSCGKNDNNNKVVVTFAASVGGSIKGNDTIEIEKGITWKDLKDRKMVPEASPINSSYKFVDWFCNNNKINDGYTFQNKTTIVAQFELMDNPYHIEEPTQSEYEIKFDQKRSYDVVKIEGFKCRNIKHQSDNFWAACTYAPEGIYPIIDIINFSEENQTFDLQINFYSKIVKNFNMNICFFYEGKSIYFSKSYQFNFLLPEISTESFSIKTESSSMTAEIEMFLDDFLRVYIPEYYKVDNKEYKITKISDSAFREKKILSITIDANIKEIGKEAFSQCEWLEAINLPTTLENIGVSAFQNCKSLLDITIPKNIKEIPKNTFDGCSSLYEVTFAPDNELKTIDEHAFNDCVSLEKIKIPKTVDAMNDGCFKGCGSLNNVVFEEGSLLPKIGDNAFNDCRKLKSIDIPDSVKEIGGNAFNFCSGLEKVNISPNSQLEKIGYSAFYDCVLLKSIYIPSKVNAIGQNAFVIVNTKGLTEIDISSINSDVVPSGWSDSAFALSPSVEKGIIWIDNENHKQIWINYFGISGMTNWEIKIKN